MYDFIFSKKYFGVCKKKSAKICVFCVSFTNNYGKPYFFIKTMAVLLRRFLIKSSKIKIHHNTLKI